MELREAKKTTFKKVVFAWDCLHFFALETPQDGPKRPRRLQKSVLREFRDLKKGLQMLTKKKLILEQILDKSWGQFWAQNP